MGQVAARIAGRMTPVADQVMAQGQGAAECVANAHAGRGHAKEESGDWDGAMPMPMSAGACLRQAWVIGKGQARISIKPSHPPQRRQSLFESWRFQINLERQDRGVLGLQESIETR
jgi:hypothetical protein